MKESMEKFKSKMLEKYGAKSLPDGTELDEIMEQLEGEKHVKSLPML